MKKYQFFWFCCWEDRHGRMQFEAQRVEGTLNAGKLLAVQLAQIGYRSGHLLDTWVDAISTDQTEALCVADMQRMLSMAGALQKLDAVVRKNAEQKPGGDKIDGLSNGGHKNGRYTSWREQ